MNSKHLTCKFTLAKENRHGKVRSVYVTYKFNGWAIIKEITKYTKEENELRSVI